MDRLRNFLIAGVLLSAAGAAVTMIAWPGSTEVGYHTETTGSGFGAVLGAIAAFAGACYLIGYGVKFGREAVRQ